jgi:hypothetical protein
MRRINIKRSSLHFVFTKVIDMLHWVRRDITTGEMHPCLDFFQQQLESLENV